MLTNELRGPHTFQVYVPSTGNAASTGGGVQFIAPFALTVTAVRIVPHAAITAHGTDYAVLTLTRHTAGASAATAADRSWIATNSAAHVAEAMTLGAGVSMTAGQTLALLKTAAGSGLVIPALNLVITYTLAGI
jgi:hypothetical protein